MTKLTLSIGGKSATFRPRAVPGALVWSAQTPNGDIGLWQNVVEEGALLTVVQHGDGVVSALLERGDLGRGPHETTEARLEVVRGDEVLYGDYVGSHHDGQALYATNYVPTDWPDDGEYIPDPPPYAGSTGSPGCFPGDVPYVPWSETLTRVGLLCQRPGFWSSEGRPYDRDRLPNTYIGMRGPEKKWNRTETHGRTPNAPNGWTNDDNQHSDGTAFWLLAQYERWPDPCLLRMAQAQVEILLNGKGIAEASAYAIHPRHFGRTLRTLCRMIPHLDPAGRYKAAAKETIMSMGMNAMEAVACGWPAAFGYAPPRPGYNPARGTRWTSLWGNAQCLSGLAAAHALGIEREMCETLAERIACMILDHALPNQPGRFYDDVGIDGTLALAVSNTDLWCAAGLFRVSGLVPKPMRAEIDGHLPAAVAAHKGGSKIRTFGRGLLGAVG